MGEERKQYNKYSTRMRFDSIHADICYLGEALYG